MDFWKAGKSESLHGSVPSVDRALNLLELLAAAPAGLNLSMICRKLAIPKSSAHNLVTTLAQRNFVSRSPDGRVYSLGTSAISFAKSSCAEADLKTLGAPRVQALSKRLGMVAQIGIREGAEARIIYRSELPGLRLDSWVGRHFDLHCTAVGKALISWVPEPEAENLIRTRGLPRHNENTLCSMEILKTQFAETRSRGFSTDNEEHELGVRCVASPIFNPMGGVAAAICVFSPAGRLSLDGMPNVGAELVKSAREISRSLADSPRGELPPASPAVS